MGRAFLSDALSRVCLYTSFQDPPRFKEEIVKNMRKLVDLAYTAQPVRNRIRSFLLLCIVPAQHSEHEKLKIKETLVQKLRSISRLLCP